MVFNADKAAPLGQEGQRSPYGTAAFILVIALVIAAFSPSLYFSFVNWDDDIHVYKNPVVTGAAETGWRDRLLTPSLGYPMPVVVGTYRLEFLLFGLAPSYFHLANLLLHLASCLLLFSIGRAVGLGPLGAAAAIALFGLHPVTSEPVSWISGRKDLMAALFCLAAIRIHLARPLALADRRSWLSLLCFAAAALSKPVALFLPLWLFLLDLFWTGRRLKQAFLSAVPFACLALVFFALAYFGQRQVGAISASEALPAHLREIWYAFGYHLALAFGLIAPLAKHIPEVMPPGFDPAVDLLPFGAIALFYGISRLVRGKARDLFLLGLTFAALAYLPSSDLIPLNRYLADSYLYLPLIGLAIAAGALFDSLGESLSARSRTGAPVAFLALSCFALFLSLRALDASAAWKNGITLWGKVYDRYPDSARVCRNFGNALNEGEQAEQALALYTECAGRFGPGLFRRNIAITLERLGRHREAVQVWQAYEKAGESSRRRPRN